MAGSVRKPQHTRRASGRRVADIIRQRRQTRTSRARRSDGRNRWSRDEPVHEEEPPLQHVRHLSRAESISEKQREPYHQFKLAIHGDFQEPSRCVADSKLGQTDVPRARRVRSGGIHRCDSLALRLSSDRSETEHTRRPAPAYVHTTGRCASVCLRTKVVSKGVTIILLTGSVNQL